MTPAEQPAADGATGITRRAILRGTGIGVAAGLVGAGLGFAGGRLTTPGGWTTDAESTGDGIGHTPESVPVTGTHQAGVARPRTPQRHALVTVFQLADVRPAAVVPMLARLGERIIAMAEAAASDSSVLPDGGGDLTVTVGLGPRPLAEFDPRALGEGLPLFAGDDAIDPRLRGGDLLLSINSDDPTSLEPALAALRSATGGEVLWSEHGFRGPGRDGIARNPFQFHDGVIVPRSDDELARDVWIDTGPLAGGTVCVIRRIRLDVDAFRARPLAEQEAIIGRRRGDGAPLSGGALTDEVDVNARTPNGRYLIPSTAHVRAAHPSFTGSGLMLRRSYAYTPADRGAGMLFICFQNDLATFERTQHRLDELDALADFETVTASGAFAILPGFDRTNPLGSTLT